MKRDVQGACNKLIEESVKLWTKSEDGVVDDITCVVIFLKWVENELEIWI